MKPFIDRNSRRPLPGHRKRLLCWKATKQIHNADLQAFGEHHHLRVVQPTHPRFYFCQSATSHIPAESLAAGSKLLLSVAIGYPQGSSFP
jgi:hypothetical protein